MCLLSEEHQKITATLMAFFSGVAARSAANNLVAANLGMVCMCFESRLFGVRRGVWKWYL